MCVHSFNWGLMAVEGGALKSSPLNIIIRMFVQFDVVIASNRYATEENQQTYKLNDFSTFFFVV